MSRRNWIIAASTGGAALLVLVIVLATTGGSTSPNNGTTSSEAATTSSGSTASSSSLSGQIAGAGASSQQAAQEAWIAAFQTANEKVTISYDPVGSGGGREQFTAGAVAYGGSDVPLHAEEFTMGQDRCGGVDNLIEAPVYVSPIAVVYNLAGIDKLQLDSSTIEPSGDWPIQGGEAAQGTSGVISAVKAGDGAIGYADESQAGSLAKAAVKVGSDYVLPSAESARKIFAASKKSSEPGKYVFTYNIDYTTSQADTYPIVLVSYMLACTKYSSTNDAKIVQGYLGYVASAEGQQAAASAAGSAPIPASVQQQIQGAAAAIQTS
jgi:phosphate transport system substrate-binding protein